MRRLVVLMAIVLAGCPRTEVPGRFRLRIGGVGPFEPIGPHLRGGYSSLVSALVFQSLVAPERSGPWSSRVFSELKPNGPSGFRFRVAAGLTFSDGLEVTGEHVAAALAGAPTLSASDGWHTLTWEGSPAVAVAALFDGVLARPTAAGFVGTGPFVLASSDEGQILLRRRAPMTNRIHEVELIAYPTPREAFAAALRGETNAFVLPSDTQIELLEGVRSLRVIRGAGLQSLVVFLNARRFDTASRRGFAQKLLEADTSRAFGPSCRPRSPRGPRAESGPPEPGGEKKLELLSFDGLQGLGTAALSIRRTFGKQLSIALATGDEGQRRGAAHDFDLFLATIQTWPIETALSRWVSGDENNFSGYSNQEFDRAFAVSDHGRAQAELEADPPVVFICDLDRTMAVDSRLSDATVGEYDLLESLDSWRVDP